MWEFIILGQVPGTSFTLTFVSWLVSLPLLALGGYVLLWLHRRQAFQYAAIFCMIFLAIHPLWRSNALKTRLMPVRPV